MLEARQFPTFTLVGSLCDQFWRTGVSARFPKSDVGCGISARWKNSKKEFAMLLYVDLKVFVTVNEFLISVLLKVMCKMLKPFGSRPHQQCGNRGK